ncbi:mucin-22-like [Mizuhopecten yessoensis]|uniref:mucin-22-like n=1 Tax=Mizuhopecten yessoensis TaxID=6573 RepID=UPI000B45EDE3|nr:mucin-22-like [Mizuhopecten yessoensis]
MDNWTSRPQDKRTSPFILKWHNIYHWPRLTGLANRDRSSVEEAQMATYESPYTAENPASFYHYSLHPDDLATRRSISVYSLKDPDRKKKSSRFPQCRVCFATMLLVSLGVAIAVAVTLAIMLSNPHPKFYRTKSADNTTLSKDFLKEKEVDFGTDICQLMSAMFDLRDSSHQSRKVTDCNVFLADSPGNMVINIKLKVDETFIKSDSNKVKAMLVANAFVLSSNYSGEKLVISVPSNKTDKSSAISDVLTPSTTGSDVFTSSTTRSDVLKPSTGSDVLTPPTTGSHDFAPSTAGSDVLTPSTTGSDGFTPSKAGSDVFTSSTTGSNVLTQSTAGSGVFASSTTLFDDLTLSTTVSDVLTPSTGSDVLTPSTTGSDVFAPSTTGSDVLTPSTTGSNFLTPLTTGPDVLTTSTTGFDVFTSSITGLSEFLSQSSSVAADASSESTYTAMLVSNFMSDDLDGTFRVSASSRDVSSSAFVLFSDESKASGNTISIQESIQLPIGDVASSTSLSAAVRISPSAALSYQNVELTSTHDKLSSIISHPLSQISPDRSEPARFITTSVLSSESVLSTMSVPNLESSEQYITPTATIQHVSSVAMSSLPGHTTRYNRHDTSSVISSEYGSYNEDMTSYARVPTVSLYASDMSMTQLGDSPPSGTSPKASDSAIIPGEKLKTSVTPGLELTAMTTEASQAPHDVSSSELISRHDLQSSLSGVSFSSAVKSLRVHSVASQHASPSYIASFVVSDVASASYTYLPDSGSASANIFSGDSAVQTELPTPVLYPSVVVDSADITTLEPDKSSQRMTVSATIRVPALQPPKARWLDTTMFMSEVAVDNNSSSMAELPMLNNDTDASSNITVPEIRKNLTLETSTSQATVPELWNRTDSMEDNIKPVIVPLLQSAVGTPLLSTTQNPTTTAQDVGRAIFESDISNRAMGTANPQDFWDNILKMVQYTSTKKPKTQDSELSTLYKNLTSDSKTLSTVDEGISSVTDSVVSDKVSASSTISNFNTASSSVTKLSDNSSSLVNSLKPSESDILEPRSSTLLLSEISARSTPLPYIRATPVLTAEPGLMSSIEQSVITEKPIMDNSTSKEYRQFTSSIGNGRSLLSSDFGNPRMDNLLSTTQDASVILFSSAQTASPPSSTVTLTEDYAFYDLIPVSLVTSPPGSTSVLSGSIVSSSDIHSTRSSPHQQGTDDMDFYDLMPVSDIALSVEISSSKIKSVKITDDLLPTGTIKSAEVSSAFRSTATQSAPTVDASLTTGIEAPATLTLDPIPSSSIKTSSTIILADNQSLNMEASTVDATLYVVMKASVTPTVDVSPSSSVETPSTDFYSSSVYRTESSGLDIDISTSASAIISTPIEVTPSLATVSNELFGDTLSLKVESHTSVSGSSSLLSVQKSSSEIKATTSLRDAIASTTTEPPPSMPAVFNVGSEFGNKLFFANDFSKMDFTRTDTESNDKSVPSSLFNTVPMIPRVTTPSIPRVRVPNLFQGEANPFQTVPTTPEPPVTKPKVIPPTPEDQKTSSSSSGQFLFDFGSLGSNFGGSLGLGNINFN